MGTLKGEQTHNTETIAPQIPVQRGLTDEKLREIRRLGDPPYEQEESDIM